MGLTGGRIEIIDEIPVYSINKPRTKSLVLSNIKGSDYELSEFLD